MVGFSQWDLDMKIETTSNIVRVSHNTAIENFKCRLLGSNPATIYSLDSQSRIKGKEDSASRVIQRIIIALPGKLLCTKLVSILFL